MTSTCSLHCGHFQSVGTEAFKKHEQSLKNIFRYINYDGQSGNLEVAGGVNVPHDPARLTEIFDMLATMLSEDGKGRIMLQCEATEVCYFRCKAWKLEYVDLPSDPFEGVRRVPG